MSTRRRALIAIGGVVTLAGCLGDTDDTQLVDGGQSVDDGQSVNDSVGTESNATADDEQPESPSEPPVPETITSARAGLDAARSTYASFAGTDDPTILDITSLTREYDFLAVVDHLKDVDSALNEAQKRTGDEFTGLIERLRQEYYLLDELVRAQRRGQLIGIVADRYVGSTAKSSPDLSLLTSRHEQMRARQIEFIQRINKAGSFLTDSFTPEVGTASQYRRKIDQLDDERTTFAVYLNAHEDFRQGVEQYNDATASLSAGRSVGAVGSAREAERSFEACLATLSRASAETVAPLTRSFRSGVESSLAAARQLQQRAEA